jgi:hypothetical protein
MAAYRVAARLDATSAAYIAGLVDGEGTITLTRIHRHENRRLVVSISNTERALLDYVRDATSVGRITSKRVYGERHRPSYTFQVSSRQALDVLGQIAPFLRSYKAARAALALAGLREVHPPERQVPAGDRTTATGLRGATSGHPAVARRIMALPD